MIFKLYDCDIGITVDGVSYDFTHVDSVVIENPERTRLIRGANAGNKIGLVYKEGVKEATTITTSAIDLSKELHELLGSAYDSEKRLDFYCISRADGSSKTAKNAVLSQRPQQLNLDDSAESLLVALVFESFDVKDIHKS